MTLENGRIALVAYRVRMPWDYPRNTSDTARDCTLALVGWGRTNLLPCLAPMRLLGEGAPR